MYLVQSQTKVPVKFQGKIIKPYEFELYPQITDYIALSRLSNSGKVIYMTVPNPAPVVEKPVETVKKSVEKKEEVKEEKVIKVIDEPVEKQSDEKVDTVESKEEKTESKKEEKTEPKKFNKKRKLIENTES